MGIKFFRHFCLISLLLPGVTFGRNAAADEWEMSKFQKEIKTAEEAATGQAQLDVCKIAFEAGRLDMMLACVNAGFIGPYQTAFKGEKDPATRAIAVLAVLSASSGIWADDPRFITYQTQHLALSEFCRPTMRIYLPPDQLNSEIFFEREKRLGLAKLFRQKLLSEGVVKEGQVGGGAQ